MFDPTIPKQDRPGRKEAKLLEDIAAKAEAAGDYQECPGEWDKIAPKALPYPWRCVQPGTDGAFYVGGGLTGDLKVICSVARYRDGKRWLHVSASRRGRHGKPQLPSYGDLKAVKALFIGVHRKAIQVFPAEEEHYSAFEVLHLWCCLDDDPLPDFRIGGAI